MSGLASGYLDSPVQYQSASPWSRYFLVLCFCCCLEVDLLWVAPGCLALPVCVDLNPLGYVIFAPFPQSRGILDISSHLFGCSVPPPCNPTPGERVPCAFDTSSVCHLCPNGGTCIHVVCNVRLATSGLPDGCSLPIHTVIA